MSATLPNGPRTPALAQTLQLVADPIAFFDRCAQQYGDTFTTRVLGWNSPPVVFFGNPDAIAQIFTAPAGQFELGKVTHVFRPLTGDRSLIMLDGEQHQRQRQLLMPPLHGDRMRTYGALICDITRQVIANWTIGEPFSIRHSTSEISLQVILRVVFGMAPGPRYEQLKQLLNTLLESVTSPLYSSQFFFPLLQQNLGTWSPWGGFLQQMQQIDALVYAEIQERRQSPSNDRADVLSLLMAAHDESGDVMSDRELRDQLMTLLLLGHETTASALAWAFYWIHQTPAVLQQLQQDISAWSDDPDALAQLPYLTAVCKESLRVYPIALISQPRKVKEPVTIGSCSFDPGTIVIPCIYLAHRRAQTYPQPEQFQPDRFLQNKFTPYEFLPFGGGVRSCIGAAFSLYEMKLVLATVLSAYQLELANTGAVMPARRGITFVPSKQFRMRAVAPRGAAQDVAFCS
ncbi:cytochrome P450 [Leptolyngbya sp. FACHB-36]|uniref:cytochrome P450 n=1 Tax=Leptolyngbya sp. FACHB-36 TaxID=2692808 RepID=UPI001680DFF7|nr:cytochrome P450 [Leptolyngbya sp. FACHB-36]MBD2022397.1 cytochrome P450 [Leptolyngbya sp. FACHB-36]